jgi:hypothetical protein
MIEGRERETYGVVFGGDSVCVREENGEREMPALLIDQTLRAR